MKFIRSKPKTLWIIILTAIVMTMLSIGLMNMIDAGHVRQKIKTTQVVKLENKSVLITPMEVGEQRHHLEKDLDAFLNAKWTKKNGTKSAYAQLVDVFSYPGAQLPKTEKQRQKFYKSFSYKITEAGGQKTQIGARLLVNVEIYVNGKRSDSGLNLLIVQMNTAGGIDGVQSYGKTTTN